MIAEQAAPICVSNAQLIVIRFSIKLGEVDHNSSFSDRNGLFLIVTVWVVDRIVTQVNVTILERLCPASTCPFYNSDFVYITTTEAPFVVESGIMSSPNYPSYSI